LIVVAEMLSSGVNQTYSTTHAGQFDAIVVGNGAAPLFVVSSSLAGTNSSSGHSSGNSTSYMSTLYPPGRPLQILQDGYRWGKPIAAVSSGNAAFHAAGFEQGEPGVYTGADDGALVDYLREGLMQFKFLERYPLDQ
jgi:catalase